MQPGAPRSAPGCCRFSRSTSLSRRSMTAFDEVDLAGPIKGSPKTEVCLFSQHLTLDAHQVAFSACAQVRVAGEDDRPAKLIFRGNRGVAKHPSTPVGMHERQLPRELAVIV